MAEQDILKKILLRNKLLHHRKIKNSITLASAYISKPHTEK